MADLNEALRQFDACESNLRRLEKIWEEAEQLIPTSVAGTTDGKATKRYGELELAFAAICKAMPKIDGFELENKILDLDSILQCRIDALEVGDISAEVTTERFIFAQGEALQEYGFRLLAQRRALVRSRLAECLAESEALLRTLEGRGQQPANNRVTEPEWEDFKEKVAQIEVLGGASIPAPPRWGDLKRHIHFGLECDLNDIIRHDWPAARDGLQQDMYGPHDPLPVDVPDIAKLTEIDASGPVITALKWGVLDDEAFERLVFNIVSDAEGYNNPLWLTRTNAPDRGRDISVQRVTTDSLSGSRSYRLLIQCRHWHKRSINVEEVTKLLTQMKLWEPPRVDELAIATSGRFTTDAVAWIEKHNHEGAIPTIQMWPESHLESLLASRPYIVAEFGLR